VLSKSVESNHYGGAMTRQLTMTEEATTMKKTITALATAGLLLGTVGQAQANELIPGVTWSGNFAVTSNYIFRGESETRGGVATQGGFDLEHETGLYAGTWLSSLKDPDVSMEVNLYGGLARDINDFMGVDIGVLHFMFPGGSGSDEFTEVYAGLNFALADLDTGAYAIFNTDGDYNEFVLDFSHPLVANMYTFGELGYHDADDGDAPDFTWWGVGVGITYAGLDFTAMYSDNDVSSRPSEGSDGAQYAFTVSAEF